MKPSLSKHRHISFTAHYTGYIWYKMGISHQVFATRKGRSSVSLAHPLETWAEKFVGGSMRSTLKQRHQMSDQTLEALIAQYPDLQVLEIACGLSPRGGGLGSNIRILSFANWIYQIWQLSNRPPLNSSTQIVRMYCRWICLHLILQQYLNFSTLKNRW